MSGPRSIAIVGAAGCFPGAADLGTFWRNIVERKVAVREVPAQRWPVPAGDMVDAAGSMDRTRSMRAGLIDPIEFDGSGLDLPEGLLERLDPLARLTLRVGTDCWNSAALRIDKARVGVVLANIALPTDGASRLAEAAFLALLDETLQLPPVRTESLDRCPSALPTGLLARALGLGGGSYALDAACASSLYALHLACADLEAGRVDAVIAGGVSLPQVLYTQVGFTQLKALSPTGVCSPFDKRADGLVVGEGAGMFVLRRLNDAVNDGNRVYAVIRGIGLSNDVGGSLLSPEREGQLRSMRAAYEQAGWKPGDVQLIECHGTGTPRGDAVELSSITALLGDAGAVIGSVKSNVGHLLTAAGSAALCKVLGALEAGTLPPSANYAKATQADALAGLNLRVLEAPEPWIAVNGLRRAAVSGFGFGGINAHVLLESYAPGSPAAVSRRRQDPPIAIVGMATHVGPLDSLRRFQHAYFRGEAVRDERPATRWYGSTAHAPRGAWLSAITMPVGRFRIPPLEMASILPQQLLMLKVAADAIDDAKPLGHGPHLDAGAVIGLGLDLETTSFHLRWVLRNRLRVYLERQRLEWHAAELDEWIARALDALGPPLDPARTLGALGGIVPSRIAREFQFGGPSFAVANEDASGLRALEVAARMLQRGEARVMLAGAVDIAGDMRQVIATGALRPYSKSGTARPFDAQGDGPLLGEGAAAVVLKRLDDALRDGDRVYSVIRGIGAASGVACNPGAPRVAAIVRAAHQALHNAGLAPTVVTLHAAHGSADPGDDLDEATALNAVYAQGAVTAAAGVIGQTGAASGLVSAIGASLSLFHELIPPMAGFRSAMPALGTGVHVATAPQVWLRNRAEGPRVASVGAMGIDGSAIQLIVQGHEHPPQAHRAARARPLGPRGAAIFLARTPDELASYASSQTDDIEVVAARWHRRGAAGPCAYVATDLADLLRQLDKPRPASPSGPIAFVFPGSGNHFLGMGRSLGVAMPEVYRALDAEVDYLARQSMPEWITPWRRSWGTGWEAEAAAALAGALERVILGQVAHGVAVSDALRMFGVRPSACIGYSLGESTALFAARAWRARDEMCRRTLGSELFRTQLAGAKEVARKAWGAGDWHVVVVNRHAHEVRAALQGTAALLIVNAPGECVVGGRRPDVVATVARLGCEALALDAVPTVHLPLVDAVAHEYRALHELPTTPPDGMRFYSAAWAKSYVPTRLLAAESILDNAVHGFDFQALIEQAYADGIRVFVEPGPQASCTRMIGRILSGRPHVAVSADLKDRDGFHSLLTAVARAAEAGAPVNLDVIYGADAGIELQTRAKAATVDIALSGSRPPFPPPPRLRLRPNGARTAAPPWVEVLQPAQAVASAHEAFLKVSRQSAALQLQALAQQRQLMARLRAAAPVQAARRVAFDRAQCLEFATGRLANVLGPDFATVDTHPTRVRLPAEPLMLVDRITEIEGTRGVPGPGRVVTEHDVLPDAWYLDGGRAPVCISVEAGQADLFLSAYLGIDLKTRGGRVYRLLDAKIAFHRDLPMQGETIRYDIRIDRFIEQGDTWIFFFRFDGTIAGQPFITMRDGCAGFFSAEQLDGGRGIFGESRPAAPAVPRPGTTRFVPLLNVQRQSLSDAQVQALRAGALAEAFGEQFAGRRPSPGLRLPGGRMHLVDRVLELDPHGGRYGQGVVHGESDITPDQWFLACHFVNDPVMPGTLMYECCLHTLRIMLLRMGWIGDEASPDVHLAPIEGCTGQLRCRGQVVPGTTKVGYRIEVREIGYDPAPYVLADASMLADGRHIVQMEGLSVRIRGLTRERVEATWAGQASPPAVYSRRQILAYAEGNPSECFGPRYLPFDRDRDRRLARLPRPPFLFLDRITSVEPPPWVLSPGGWVEGAFDVDPDAWFFTANQQRAMPFAVLLEAALQPCGWLSAYVGSALTSSEDLHYRNLDGVATQHREVLPDVGTLTSRARMTKTSQAGGMILQEFEMQILSGAGLVYEGVTGFGFFPAQALAQQVGVRGAALADTAGAQGFDMPKVADDSGFALPASSFSMVDRVDVLQPDGGAHGLGFVAGSKRVDPDEWFFAAHFYQDPVMPGSLGLEAMLQLLKVLARHRRADLVQTHRFETMALGARHRWQYRGQVVATNMVVHVQATVTARTDDTLTADGLLAVDGRVIYAMKDFTLRLVAR